jgi:lipopolysaccharide transport system ATP-binding protein
MTDDVIIQAENLGKRYVISHDGGRRGSTRVEPYKTLREVLAAKAHGLVGQSKQLLGGERPNRKTTEVFWALKNLDFEVRRGEAFGIIGRNGAGKSTLLKVLSRITEPSEGRVTIKGRVASLLEVGTGFHPELTGRENIFLNGAVLGMSRAEVRRKFDEIVNFADVERFLDTPIKRYSSGMYVRLAFAVAAHLEPEILIVDEVLAVGDVEFQKKCLGKMRDVSSHGRTVMFVSHNMGLVERLCGRVLHLEHGVSAGVYEDAGAGIAAYLEQSENGGNPSEWRGSPAFKDNPYFVAEHFSTSSASGPAGSGRFSNAFPVNVEIVGTLKIVDPALHLGIGVYTEEGNMLFVSYATDVAEDAWMKLSPGPIHLRTEIPARQLNEGTYRLELLVGLHFRQWLYAPGNSPTISFSIQGGLSDSPFWVEKRPGLLAPVLPWEKIG